MDDFVDCNWQSSLIFTSEDPFMTRREAQKARRYFKMDSVLTYIDGIVRRPAQTADVPVLLTEESPDGTNQ